jgi:hypothetical protein
MPIFLVVLAGCKTNTPMVRHHPWTMQTKLQAVHHWREFAKGMAHDLQARGQFEGCTFSVENIGPESEFSSAFAKLLVSALIEGGFKIAQPNKGASLKIVLGHQIIVHGRRFGHCGLVSDITGRGSMNATGIVGGVGLAVRNWFTGDESGSPGTTRGEVLTTLWINKKASTLYCANQIAYFNIKDASLYLSPDELVHFSGVEQSRSGLFNWFSAIMGDDSRW